MNAPRAVAVVGLLDTAARRFTLAQSLLRPLIVIVALVATLAACATAPSTPRALATEDFQVASNEPGISLFVRNKRPADMATFSAAKTVLFVHGATFPAESTFDLKLGGTSWMDYIARQGYDVYFVDVRGYGGSTRPPAADGGPPLATSAQALADVGAAVDFIRQRRGIERMNLMAWSLGTVKMGHYAALHPQRVHKLVLYAPVWLRPAAAQAAAAPVASDAASAPALPTYRQVDVAGSRARWLNGVPAAKQAGLIPAGWFDAWVAANAATDPWGAAQNPPVMRVPNGPLHGLRARQAGQAPYEPADVRAPVLLVKGEWDADTPAVMAQALFARLVNTPYKQYLEIGEGTHSVMLERNRMQLFRAVQGFLDDPDH